MPPALPPVRILIVDDDKSICDYMQTWLCNDGFDVVAVQDPLAAEPLLRSQQFHIVILDIMMPQLDGIELLRRIRKFDSDVAVIVFTGYPNLQTAIQSLQLQAVDYIEKPFSIAEFRRVLQRVVETKKLRRTPEQVLHLTLGQTIRNLRSENKLTLKQMARRTGLSVSLLSQIERAESSASLASLYKIAHALNVRVQELFDGC